MRPRRAHLGAALAAVLLAGLTGPASAAKPAPTSTELPDHLLGHSTSAPGRILEGIPVGRMRAAAAPRIASSCNLGVSTGAAYIVDYLAPPDDAYDTFLDPSQCGCASGAVELHAAHLLLNFQAACAQPVRVRIVGATSIGAGCWQPDPGTTLCGPVLYDLTPGAPGNYQFNLPLTAGCCLQGPAFLEIDFTEAGAGCDAAGTRPRLITTATCDPCRSWNLYPGGTDDLCDGLGFPGNPVMWADGDCCTATPAIEGSWGRLKILYR